jgi:hypothetical protein
MRTPPVPFLSAFAMSRTTDRNPRSRRAARCDQRSFTANGRAAMERCHQHVPTWACFIHVALVLGPKAYASSAPRQARR